MNIKNILLLSALISCPFLAAAQKTNDVKLWYTTPATRFDEALPIGNGRLGAMVYGGIHTERLSLNEATLWAGKPIDATKINPDAKNYLQPIRTALFNEDYKRADSLMRFAQGPFSESYAPLGNLFLNFDHKGDVVNYKRELDIQNALTKVSYTINGTTYVRELFASYPDQVILIKLTAVGKDKLNFTCKFTSLLTAKSSLNQGGLQLKGWAPIHAEPSYRDVKPDIIYDLKNGMRFCSLLNVLATDGQQSSSDTTLKINNASSVVLALSMATSYNGYDKNPGTEGKAEQELARSYVKKVSDKSFDDLKTQHQNDFRKYFDRVTFSLGQPDEERSTPERLNRFSTGHSDNSMFTLFYQYSRYLLISSSRPGGMATNLQALWNEMMRPPWSSNYTVNINTQMNYWGVETANLSEMHQPLFELIAKIAQTGQATAKNYYNAAGWACNHNTDIWGMSNPIGGGTGSPCWANWPMGGVWLSTHLWEHYAFTQDRYFLKTQGYPLMKGAVRFCLDILTDDKKGNLITAPSTSPENVYLTDKNYAGETSYGGTADLAMIRELFTDYLKAAAILNVDTAMQRSVNDALKKLYPYQVGEAGDLQEWYHDWNDKDPKHNHLSHLFGFYPGYTITTSETPKLADAVKNSLIERTNRASAWGVAWRANVWARLQNADMAYDALKNLLYSTNKNGHMLANLLSGPGYQIDANFGGGAAISETLLQSHQGYIELLPALPKQWPQGKITGLVARGGFVIDMEWKDGQLTSTTVFSRFGGPCTIKYGSKTKTIATSVQKNYTYQGSEIK